MQEHELRALLGPAYDDTDTEQRLRIDEAHAAIARRWPEPDLADTRREALNGAMLVVLGDATLEDVADQMRTARAAYEDALAALTGALIVSAGRPVQVRDGRGGGYIRDGSEVDLAARAGISRLTVRKALGK